jgi:hypothetical protein
MRKRVFAVVVSLALVAGCVTPREAAPSPARRALSFRTIQPSDSFAQVRSKVNFNFNVVASSVDPEDYLWRDGSRLPTSDFDWNSYDLTNVELLGAVTGAFTYLSAVTGSFSEAVQVGTSLVTQSSINLWNGGETSTWAQTMLRGNQAGTHVDMDDYDIFSGSDGVALSIKTAASGDYSASDTTITLVGTNQGAGGGLDGSIVLAPGKATDSNEAVRINSANTTSYTGLWFRVAQHSIDGGADTGEPVWSMSNMLSITAQRGRYVDSLLVDGVFTNLGGIRAGTSVVDQTAVNNWNDTYAASIGGGGATIQAEWTFSTSTGDADPGVGRFRMNDVVQTNTSLMFVSDITKGGLNVQTLLSILGTDSRVYVQQRESATQAHLFRVTNSVISAVGYVKIPVEIEATFTNDIGNNRDCLFVFYNAASSGGLTTNDSPSMAAGTIWSFQSSTVETDASTDTQVVSWRVFESVITNAQAVNMVSLWEGPGISGSLYFNGWDAWSVNASDEMGLNFRVIPSANTNNMSVAFHGWVNTVDPQPGDTNVQFYLDIRALGVGEGVSNAVDTTVTNTFAVDNTADTHVEFSFDIPAAQVSGTENLAMTLRREGALVSSPFNGVLGIMKQGQVSWQRGGIQ